MPKGYKKDGTPFGFKKGNQLGKLLKGIKRSSLTKEKLRISKLGNKNGVGNKNALGKHHIRSEQYIEKLKEGVPKGENHHNWKDGNSQYYRRKVAPRPKPNNCEVCGAMDNICLDHDHKTNKFRGWICHRCNVALGMVKDNSETLIALAEYLKKSRNIT